MAEHPLSPQDQRRHREAEWVLERTRRESQTLGGSALGQLSEQPDKQRSGPADRIEIWGRRIGRSLAAGVCLLLLWQLVASLWAGK